MADAAKPAAAPAKPAAPADAPKPDAAPAADAAPAVDADKPPVDPDGFGVYRVNGQWVNAHGKVLS